MPVAVSGLQAEKEAERERAKAEKEAEKERLKVRTGGAGWVLGAPLLPACSGCHVFLCLGRSTGWLRHEPAPQTPHTDVPWLYRCVAMSSAWAPSCRQRRRRRRSGQERKRRRRRRSSG